MAEPELGQPFCGLSSSALAEAAGAECKWNHNPVLVAHNIALPAANITYDQVSQLFRQACASWSSVCGIDMRWQENPAANIFAGAEPMDGPNGVLGESYLPCGNVTQMSRITQRYDTGERWTLSFFYRVLLHELGHAIGLPHAPQGTAVMSPYLTDFAVPQAWDIEQLISRYGPAVPQPTPPQKPIPQPPSIPDGLPQVDLIGSGGKMLPLPVNLIVPVPAAGNYLITVRNPKPKHIRITMTAR